MSQSKHRITYNNLNFGDFKKFDKKLQYFTKLTKFPDIFWNFRSYFGILLRFCLTLMYFGDFDFNVGTFKSIPQHLGLFQKKWFEISKFWTWQWWMLKKLISQISSLSCFFCVFFFLLIWRYLPWQKWSFRVGINHSVIIYAVS